uniref:Uncharacterized protein n=1 Tax=Timema bartmani TaxID=61472 RepID=A0A7R9HYG7_9NEOP|nr:unnamed protein product [Timema bartmani]
MVPAGNRARDPLDSKPGMESTETTSLNRVNTCTTYISIRRKNNSVCSPPAKSASLRPSGDHAAMRGNHVETGRLNTYLEDEI